MPTIISILLIFAMHFSFTVSNRCQSDRNQDHRPRFSCVSQGLTAIPDGVDPHTEVLVLAGNLLTSLAWSEYSGFTELHELDLSHNQISVMDPPGPVLRNLSVLRLSGNKLTGLGGGVFRCSPNLMEIYLDGNHIRSLHDATFSDLQHLEVINLSGNVLPALPPQLLQRVSSDSLKTFDLENNSISLMPDGFFSSKPELPYVYLSQNPWLCGCAVSYLHSYLNDQDHNIYRHDGPNDIVPGAESVVCAGPPHLASRPIIELTGDDFCPSDPLTDIEPFRGDFVFEHSDIDSLHLTNPNRTQSSSTLHYLTTYWRTPGISFLAQLTTPWTQPSSPITAIKSSTMFEDPTQMPAETTPAIKTTLMYAFTSQWETTIPTTTAQPETHISRTSVTTLRDSPTKTRVGTSTSTGQMERKFRTNSHERLLPWCWWLFTGFVLLCVLSAFISCFMLLWILKSYLLVRSKRMHCSVAHLDSNGVKLQAFKYRKDTVMQGNNTKESQPVEFLAQNQVKDFQPVFRSVLYIVKDEIHGMRDVEDNESDAREVLSNTELVATSDKEREEESVAGRGEAFRKTLYRVISQEESSGWMEEEEYRERNRDVKAARYSLILREESESQRKMEWVVREWEMGL